MMGAEMETRYQERLARYVTAMRNGQPDRVPLRRLVRRPDAGDLLPRHPHAEIARARILDDVGLDRPQPGRARPANLSARRAAREIVNGICGHAAGRASSACWIFVARAP